MTTETTRRALFGSVGLVAVALAAPAIASASASATATTSPSTDRSAWDKAFREFAEVKAASAAVDALYDATPEPGKRVHANESDRIGEILYEKTRDLFDIAAPDHAALLWKTEYLFGDTPTEDSSCASWSSEVMNVYLADHRRLLGPEAR